MVYLFYQGYYDIRHHGNSYLSKSSEFCKAVLLQNSCGVKFSGKCVLQIPVGKLQTEWNRLFQSRWKNFVCMIGERTWGILCQIMKYGANQ